MCIWFRRTQLLLLSVLTTSPGLMVVPLTKTFSLIPETQPNSKKPIWKNAKMYILFVPHFKHCLYRRNPFKWLTWLVDHHDIKTFCLIGLSHILASGLFLIHIRVLYFGLQTKTNLNGHNNKVCMRLIVFIQGKTNYLHYLI